MQELKRMAKRLFLILLIAMLFLSGCESVSLEAENAETVLQSALQSYERKQSQKSLTPKESISEGMTDSDIVDKVNKEAGTDLQEKETNEPVNTQETVEEQKENQAEKGKSEATQSKTQPETDLPEKKQSEKDGARKEGEDRKGKKKEKTPASDSAGNSKQTVPSNLPEKTPDKEEHICSWDGGTVTSAATCGSTGVKTYKCKICGKSKTESVPKTSHNYVTESTQPTCTEAGKTKTCCSICGSVQSETAGGAPLGHDFVKSYWPSAPTCRSGGSYNLTCTRCGADGGSGSDPALPHSPVSREVTHGDCATQTIVVTECSVCGAELGRDAHFEDVHDWVTTVSDPIWDEAAEDFVTHEITYCRRCPAKK